VYLGQHALGAQEPHRRRHDVEAEVPVWWTASDSPSSTEEGVEQRAGFRGGGHHAEADA